MRHSTVFAKTNSRIPVSGLGALLVSVLFLGACTPLHDEQKAKGPLEKYPIAAYRDSTVLTMHEGSRLSWIMRTHHLVKQAYSDKVESKPVDLRVYDSTGAEIVHVTSDSGTVNEAVTFLAAIGRVRGKSHKGLEIEADSLRWNKNENRVSTESRVKVRTEEGDVLTGKGFVSDANLDNWQILSNVKGVFQKIEERIEKADTAATPGSETQAPKTDSTRPAEAQSTPSPSPDSLQPIKEAQ